MRIGVIAVLLGVMLALAVGLLVRYQAQAPREVEQRPRASYVNDRQEILGLHRGLIDAHKAGDVDALLAAESDDMVTVARGEVLFPSRNERVRDFERYLRSIEFDRYRDLIDPIVSVSGDGTLGWLIAQVEIAGSQTGEGGEEERVDSVWAWIELYEKREGRWYRVGEVSSVKPQQ